MDAQSEKTPDEAADTHNLRADSPDAREYAQRAYLLVSEVRGDPNPVSSDRRIHSLEERVHILEQQVDILAAALSKFASTI
jgi:hypothetical protein